MSSSRIALDAQGRTVVIVTTPADGLPVGHRFVVLGNLVLSTVAGDTILFGWLGASGRPPTARERAEAQPPYESPAKAAAWQRRAERDAEADDERLAARCETSRW